MSEDSILTKFMSTLDVWLEPIQRLVIIAAVLIGGWHFLFREENAPRVAFAVERQEFPQCAFRVALGISNVGASVFTIESVVATLSRAGSVKPLSISSRTQERVLRSSEGTVLAFDYVNVFPSDQPFVVFRAVVNLDEDGRKQTRLVDEAIGRPSSCAINGNSP